MLDNKSSGDRLPSKDGFRPLPLEVGQNGKRDVHKQPTLAELREALQVLGAGGQKESGALRDDMFLVFAKADPKPIDFDKSLKDMDADSLDALAQPNGSRFSPEQFTRIRKITADELKAIKGDADKVSKLSPLLIKTLSATAVLGFLDDKDKPNRFIDLMDKKQAEALLFRLDQDPAFRLFLKDQAPKVKADVAKLVEGLKENLGLGVKADPPGKPPGDPLEPRPPKKPADVPAPPPKLTEKEKEQLPKLVEELKDALAKDKFAQWCGPKGEKLGELALLLNRPGADAKDVKECQKIIESITPAQIKTLDPAQLAGLTGPVIAQMNMHALIGLTNEQIAVLTKHQHTA
jgi:hypothetical protein